MLFLVFQVGADRFALEAARVVEVLAMVELQKIAGAPVGTAGEFVYRGESVPVLDLCLLTLGRPSNLRLSTRVSLLRHEPQPGMIKPLGLIAEHATATASCLSRSPMTDAAWTVIACASPSSARA